jgi:hypothetical protein
VGSPVTVQSSDPSLGVETNRVSYAAPPLRDSSMRTLPERDVEFHWMDCDVPMRHTSPPFGTLTWIVAVAPSVA